MSVGAYGIHLWMKLYVFRYRAPYICQGAAAVLACEVGAYCGIEAYTEGAEERAPVDSAEVALRHMALGDYAHGRGRVDRYAKMASQTVARAAGYYAEYRVGMAEGACGFVYRTVAAGGQYSIISFFYSLTGEPCGVAPRTCVYCLYFIADWLESLTHERLESLFASESGYRVDYEQEAAIGCFHRFCRVEFGVCYFANLANSLQILLQSGRFSADIFAVSAIIRRYGCGGEDGNGGSG